MVKGLLLRHFRWWSERHDIFNIDGCLNIGFAYQNFYMCEDYNSPQSVYWALKSFLALGLSDDHPFWKTKEKPLPIGDVKATYVRAPMHILCNTGNHHFLLSSGQFCPWPLKATEAKYGKFAYSSHFGFSVPTGPLIQQMAPDSTIAISKDGGDTWRVPWKVKTAAERTVVQLKRGVCLLEDIPAFWSSWKPWKDADVYVETVLVASCSRWPDWYVRFTSIKNQGASSISASVVQGGFANQGRASKRGEALATMTDGFRVNTRGDTVFTEGTLESVAAALVCSDAGASGMRLLPLYPNAEKHYLSGDHESHGEILKPDANTNLMWQRTLIPTIRSETKMINQGDAVHLVSAVFAVARTPDKLKKYEALDLQKLWEDVPVIYADGLASQPSASDQVYIDIGVSN